MRSAGRIAMILLLIGGIVATPIYLSRQAALRRARNEAMAEQGLALLVQALRRYITLDNDGSKGLNWWRGDVRSLHDLVPRGGTEPIALIPRDLALAEPGKPDSRPWNGYWFVAVEKPTGFAFCAYPDEYRGSGLNTLYVDETGPVSSADTEGRPVSEATGWPTQGSLRQYYSLPD